MAPWRSSARIHLPDAPRMFGLFVLALASSVRATALPQQQQPVPTAQPNLPTASPRLQAETVGPPPRTGNFVQAKVTPENVEVRGDGRCMTARPGDTVRFTLTVEGVDAAQDVVGDLRLRWGRSPGRGHDDPLLPDFRSMGGGGVGVRDGASPDVFHFAFKVPDQIYGGKYLGVGVEVRAGESGAAPSGNVDRGRSRLSPTAASHADALEVTRHTRNAVKAYCLNVASSFGVDMRPAVTSFAPGPVETPTAPASVQPK